MDKREMALKLHRDNKGKLEIVSKVPVTNGEELSLAYTPGVAEPCKEIEKNKEDVYLYTAKGNTVAVITDGSAVLGLGDIGPEASLPVMEGKSILFKEFGNIDSIPICIDSNDVEDIIKTVKLISPSLGGINLEDISAPRCFEIEERLKAELDIPVFHDDQHGTAVVVLAGILNSVRLLDKDMSELKIVVNGSGAAGIAITKLLLKVGVGDVILCDTKGAIYEGRDNMNSTKIEMASITNRGKESGTLSDVIVGKDVFVGVSAPNSLTQAMVKTMGKDAVVFALSNPVPEIYPDQAKAAGARIVATGRSDFPNQINNVLAFPGIFRGALDIRAKAITDEMKIAAAEAIASIVQYDELSEDYIIPDPFNREVVKRVAKAVEFAAMENGNC
ncbi:NAD-dependent malic enzyme [Andreesenia angusta]|uniref:NAD-dependent malic enzyme n=1 Tax=Andreesenia angusta TaxID=39480 RepID=A0A1S1V6Z1_9FIRM|nr:malic enzyme-like NAD(P)-binding protein [Andreesenia angusta]OHW61459.1 NAD-dependent malic enzyme [Andreesenia angusta]